MFNRQMQIIVLIMVVLVLGSVSNAGLLDPGDPNYIEFVNIGYAGNPGDTRDEAYPYGCGAVDYNYRIGKYEITNAQWNTFVSVAGAPTGNPSGAYGLNAHFTGDQQPTNCISWYEAAQFCNYLTSGDKSQGAYEFSGDNSNPENFLGVDRIDAISEYGTVYVIPTEDEWYKAAYYTGSGYSTFANGLDTIPTADNGWNYYEGAYTEPWNVGTGTEEQNGTFDMMGNVWEWNETLIGSSYVLRGGSYYDPGLSPQHDDYLSSSHRTTDPPDDNNFTDGFRVVQVPEPGTLGLLLLGSLAMLRRRRS